MGPWPSHCGELPDSHIKLIDLEPSLPPQKAAEMLANEFCSGSEENQLALGEGKRLGLRLAHTGTSIFGRDDAPQRRPAQRRGNGNRRPAVIFDICDSCLSKFSRPVLGRCNCVCWRLAEFSRRVERAGMYPGDPGALGVECVGEITALGPEVTDWSIGDQVLAIPHRGYCTYANAPVNMIFRRPPNLSLADAATLLCRLPDSVLFTSPSWADEKGPIAS